MVTIEVTNFDLAKSYLVFENVVARSFKIWFGHTAKKIVLPKSREKIFRPVDIFNFSTNLFVGRIA